MDKPVWDNPFPGLRSYTPEQSDLFFGRDRQVTNLRRKLDGQRFVAVVGRSGDGKSSLVRAGLIPVLRADPGPGDPAAWEIEEMRPQADPMARLAHVVDRVLCRNIPSLAKIDVEARLARIEATLSRSSRGLAELLAPALGDRPFFLLVDQFEELFRFDRKHEGRDDFEEAATFVDLLLTATRIEHPNIHVVLTMRSDYLGDCPRFRDLPEAINDSQFLVPRLTRNERRAAIEGPVKLRGAAASTALIQRLLNDAGDAPDMLPVLQHVLMRTWETAVNRNGDADTLELTLEDYAATGGMAQALSNHADTVLASLDETERAIAKTLFQTLIDVDDEKRVVRRAQAPTLSDLAALCDTDEATVAHIVDTFRAPGRCMLMPPAEEALSSDTLIDISHEALIRRWKRVADWVDEEAEDARIWRSLLDAVQTGTRALPEETANVRLHWWETRKPPEVWSRRYGGEWTKVRDLLENSAKDIKDKRREKFRWRLWRFGTAAVAVLAVVGFAGWYAIDKRRENERIAEDLRQEAIREQERQQELAAAKAFADKLALTSSAVSNVAPTKYAEYPVADLVNAKKAMDLVKELEEEMDGTDPILSDLQSRAVNNLLKSLDFVTELHRFTHVGADGGRSTVRAAGFIEDDRRIVTFSDAGLVRIWGADTPQEPEAVVRPSDFLSMEHSHGGRAIAVSSLGDIALGTSRGAIAILRKDDSADPGYTVIEVYPGPVFARTAHSAIDIAFSQSGERMAAALLSGEVLVWRRDPGPESEKTAGWVLERSLKTGRIMGMAIRRAALFGEDIGEAHNRAWSVDFDRTGSFLAVGLQYGHVCLVNIETLQSDCSQKGHPTERPVKAVRFHPTSNKLISGANDDRVVVWRLQPDGFFPVPETTGPSDGNAGSRVTESRALQVSEVVLHQDSDVWDANFSRDGKTLAVASWDGSIRVYSTIDWKPVAWLRGHENALREVKFDATGRRLVSASIDGTARIWTPFAFRSIDRSLSHKILPDAPTPYGEAIDFIAAGPLGAWAAFGNFSTVWLKFPFEAPQAIPIGGPADGPVKIDDIIAPQDKNVVLVPVSQPGVAMFTPDPGADTQTKHWLRLPGENMSQGYHRRLAATDRAGTAIAVVVEDANANASIVVCRLPDPVDAADCDDDSPLHIATVDVPSRLDHPAQTAGCARGSYTRALALSDDLKYLAEGRHDCLISVTDLESGERSHILGGHVGSVVSLDFTPDGTRLVSGSQDWEARIWSLADEKSVRLQGHRAQLSDAMFSPAGKTVASSSFDELIIIWDAETGQEIGRLPGHESNILTLDFARGTETDLLFTGTSSGELRALPYLETNAALENRVQRTLDEIGIAPAPD